jgi:hypothetical protein
MTKISGQAQSFVREEPLEVQIVESYSAADRNDLAGGEKDPSQTSAYQLQWRPTEKQVLVVEGRKRVCHVGLVRHTVEVQGNLVSVAGIGGVLARCECRGRGYCRIAMEAAEAFALRPDGREFHPALLQAGTAEFLWTLGSGKGFKPRVGRAGPGECPAPACFDG